MAELSNAEIDTATGTNKVYQATFDQLTNLVGEVTDSVLCASDPTASPTSTVEYCGCPQCTQSVWDTVVCNEVAGSPGVTECFSCGDRIAFKQSSAGGSLSLSEACTFVSEETFLNDQCGPMCNPDTCITPEVSVLYGTLNVSFLFLHWLYLSLEVSSFTQTYDLFHPLSRLRVQVYLLRQVQPHCARIALLQLHPQLKT